MDTKYTPSATRSYLRYIVELSASLAGFAAVLVFRSWLLRGPMRHATWTWETVAVALLPMIPMAFMVAAILRFIRSMDELMRRIQTESLAIAGIVTALSAASYGLVENPPFFPFISAWFTYVLFGLTWLFASILLQRRYR